MKKLKVLFTTNIPVPYRIDFFNELGKIVDLTVTFERQDAKTRDSSWLKSKIKYFNGVFLKGIKLGDDIAICPGIINVINKGKFDRIIIGIYYSPTGIFATQFLRIKSIPFIFSSDGGFIKRENKFKYYIKKYLQSGAYLYLTPSIVADKILKHYGIDENKLKRYPFTSLTRGDIIKHPFSDKEKSLFKRDLNIKESFIILGIGRLLDWKGWDILIAISEYLGDNVGIYIIGGDASKSCYSQYVKTGLPRNLHFEDFKEKNLLSKYYKAADIFVLPTRGDIWGLVINEAMGFGLPVLTTDKCGAGLELIEDGINGYITKTNDKDSLIERILYLINNPTIRQSMSFNNLEKSPNYTIEKMAKKYFEHIKN